MDETPNSQSLVSSWRKRLSAGIALPISGAFRRREGPSLYAGCQRRCPRLKIVEGNMVDEILPRDVGGKGFAMRWLQDSMTERPDSIAYFGDDTTDEDAFFELRNGVTILVGRAAAVGRAIVSRDPMRLPHCCKGW